MLRRFDAFVASALRRRPPALVHAFEGAALSTFAAARAAGSVTVLDCASAHERFVAVRRAAGDRRRHATERIRAERRLADRLLAPSEQVVQCLLEDGVPAERIVRLPYGADPQPSTGHDRSSTPFRVLFAGTIETRKGVEELLVAWRRAALPEAELVLVGPPGQGATELLRELPSGARWQGGVPHSEMLEWYRGCDVFVFPSRAEGSARVTYEAMAAGLPSVVSAESGSVVRDGRDGFVIPAGDPALLAARLRELHDSAPDARGDGIECPPGHRGALHLVALPTAAGSGVESSSSAGLTAERWLPPARPPAFCSYAASRIPTTPRCAASAASSSRRCDHRRAYGSTPRWSCRRSDSPRLDPYLARYVARAAGRRPAPRRAGGVPPHRPLRRPPGGDHSVRRGR